MLTFLNIVGGVLIFIIGFTLGIATGISRDNQDLWNQYEPEEDIWDDEWI